VGEEAVVVAAGVEFHRNRGSDQVLVECSTHPHNSRSKLQMRSEEVIVKLWTNRVSSCEIPHQDAAFGAVLRCGRA